MKTFGFKTLGCKVNQYESQALRERLLGLGLEESKGESADIYVVNTCSVTQKADKESWGAIRKLNLHNPQARIFVTGCSVQNNPEKLKPLKGVSRVLGNEQKESLPDFILSDPGKRHLPGEQTPGISSFERHTRAFLKIQDGCNNGCSYCIIPKLRGISRSRPLEKIIQEAKNLADNGYKEIVLCGICLGAYGKDLGLLEGLVKIIEELEKVDGLLRIRLSSIESSDVSAQLINKMRNSAKLCHHLHIPFQSGDDKILRLMNRPTTADDYRNLILRLRNLIPDIGITTDVMVGFPGEEEKNFNNTVAFLEEARPSRIHVFTFSPRGNTPAFGLTNKVEAKIIKERALRMKALAKELAAAFCRAYLGKPLDVLLEAGTFSEGAMCKGYSDNYIKVFAAKTQPLENKIVKLEIEGLYRDGVLACP